MTIAARPKTARELAFLLPGTEVVCDECGALHEADIMQNINGENVCAECYEESFIICAECNEPAHDRDTLEARAPRGRFDELVDVCICTDCAELRYIECDCCNVLFNFIDNYITLANGDRVCSRCVNDGDFYTCAATGEWFTRDELTYCDDDGELYSAGNLPLNVIKSYTYKPDFNPRGHLGGETYGIEIEVDSDIINANHRDTMARQALEILNAHENNDAIGVDAFAYAKNDSSLSSAGFELVTQPATYQYHMAVDYKSAFDTLARYGYRSHDTTTCGYHIHIGRDAFGSNRADEINNLSRLMWIFEKFPREIFILSRRTEYSFNRWAARYGIEEGDTPENIIGKTRGAGRYHALNFENSATVEIRIFRGTLNYETFVASLQFARLCVEIAVSRLDITDLTWGDVVAIVNNSNYNYLKSYLIKRGLTAAATFPPRANHETVEEFISSYNNNNTINDGGV